MGQEQSQTQSRSPPQFNPHDEHEKQQQLFTYVKKQVELIFSEAEISRDVSLRREMAKDQDGWIPIDVIMHYPQLHNLSKDEDQFIFAFALDDSKIVVVSEDNTKIKRLQNPPSHIDVENRTIVAQGFPAHVREEEIFHFFEDHGEICDVILIKPGSAKVIFKVQENKDELISSKQQLIFQQKDDMRDEMQNLTITVESSQQYLDRIKKELQTQQSNNKDGSTQAFVDNLPNLADIQEQIEEIFRPFYPKKVEVKIIQPETEADKSDLIHDKSDEQNVKAVISFGNETELEQAIFEVNYAYWKVGGIVIKAQKQIQSQEAKKKQTQLKPKRIIISNLPRNYEQREVMQVLPDPKQISSNYDPIQNVQYFTHERHLTDCVVVTFVDQEMSSYAMQLIKEREKRNGKMKIRGNEVNVYFCKQNQYRRLIDIGSRIQTPKSNNEETKVMIVGLCPSTNQQTLEFEMQEFRPMNIQLINTGTDSIKQFAEVTLQNVETAQRLVDKMNRKIIDGVHVHAFVDGQTIEIHEQKQSRPRINKTPPIISIDQPQVSSIVLRNLSRDIQDNNIRQLFRGFNIRNITIQPDQRLLNGTLMAVIEFNDTNLSSFMGNTSQYSSSSSSYSSSSSSSSSSQQFLSSQQDQSKQTIYIGGIPLTIKGNDINDAFNVPDAPKPIRIKLGRNNHTKEFAGYAYAVFKSITERDQVLEIMNRHIILGEKLLQMKKFGQRGDGQNIERDQLRINNQPIIESQRLMIQNLPRSLTNEQFRDRFQQQQGFVSCNIALDSGKNNNLGFGFVNFANVALAKQTHDALNGMNLFGEGRDTKIKFAQNKNNKQQTQLYIQQLPPNITKQRLRQLFGKYGVKEVIIPKPHIQPTKEGQTPTQMSRYAFVVLNQERDMYAAIREMNNQEVDGQRIRVSKARSKKQMDVYKTKKKENKQKEQQQELGIEQLEQNLKDKQQNVLNLRDLLQKQRQYQEQKEKEMQNQQAGIIQCDIHVAGLGNNTTYIELLQLFHEYGAVKAHILKDKDYGFVTFPRKEDAQNAIDSKNGSQFNGKRIKVKFGNRETKIINDLDIQKTVQFIQQKEQALAEAEEAVVAAQKQLQQAQELDNQKQKDNELDKEQQKEDELNQQEQGPGEDVEEQEQEDEEMCPICLDQLLEGENCECSADKGHRIHTDCLKEALESDFHNYGYMHVYQCKVDKDCSAVYSMELLERILDERDYLQIQELQAIDEGVNIEQAISPEPQNETLTEEEHKLTDDQVFKDLIIDTMTNAYIRHCPNPKCHRAIIKENGCEHISCPCGTHWCYCCEQDITEVMYGHFNKGDNPCPLFFDNTSEEDKEHSRKSARQAADKFVQSHPGFDDFENKLKNIFKEYEKED
ncbi:MAG: hypothetical protein EZS28_015485 [Streblomastix strix]|uniref:Uncharacterized protein n=1 Tax=Streblomastix strix TaxID=222440 RepID=A0A5J4W255_9EUKA|nr:MAG: hypothetical protein EZS28_015485 [Streblomastix strix]